VGSVQTIRGCPNHCSFCSVWRTDGQTPRQRRMDAVIEEIVRLRRRGFRFVALADDNFYPVTLALAMAERQPHLGRLEQFEGLKDVHRRFNDVGEALVTRLRRFRDHGVHVLGSFIFGLASDRPSTFTATADIADRAGLAFAQFVMLTPYPGTLGFDAWEKRLGSDVTRIAGSHPTPLVDPPGPTAEGVRVTPRDVPRGDPHQDTGGVGSVLRSSADLGCDPDARRRCGRGSRLY
jgi:radical SAM superfamily enzyme YgiQ (UPF0313 family)